MGGSQSLLVSFMVFSWWLWIFFKVLLDASGFLWIV